MMLPVFLLPCPPFPPLSLFQLFAAQRLWAFWNQAGQKWRHDSTAEHEICISIKQALAEPFPSRERVAGSLCPGRWPDLFINQTCAQRRQRGPLVVFHFTTFTFPILAGLSRRHRHLDRLEGQFRQAIIVFHAPPMYVNIPHRCAPRLGGILLVRVKTS